MLADVLDIHRCLSGGKTSMASHVQLELVAAMNPMNFLLNSALMDWTNFTSQINM